MQTETWAEIEDDIKSLMRTKVREIGYCIKQILSAPDLKENEFRELKPHRFEVGLLPLRSTARARVDLTIDATFAITNWDNESLAEKINQGIDLTSDIRQEVHNSLTDVLVEIAPNDFYLRFSERRDRDKSIEMKLADAVRTKLVAAYCANVANVIVTQVDTDDVKKVRGLLHEPHDADFKVRSLRLGEDIKFYITWRISDLDKDAWDIITRPFCNEVTISAAVREALIGHFATLDDLELRFEQEEERRALEAIANEAMTKSVNHHFGLMVNITNLRRDKTPLELEIDFNRQQKIEEGLKEKTKELDHLREIRDIERAHEKRRMKAAGELDEIEHQKYAELLSIPSMDLTAEQWDLLEDLKERSGKGIPLSGRQAIAFNDLGGLEDSEDKARILGDKRGRKGVRTSLPGKREQLSQKDKASGAAALEGNIMDNDLHRTIENTSEEVTK